uniref:MORN repeat-containing protein n=1 Tax=Marseillevirus sp. TaxID=2809551 RepID=A0AA96EMU9_9VIRU|nr:hypothetical protein MarFTMF_412 [Marseillevirus sp.]
MQSFFEQRECVSFCLVVPEIFHVSCETTEENICYVDTQQNSIIKKQKFHFFLDNSKNRHGPFCSVFEKWRKLENRVENSTYYTRVKKIGKYTNGKKHGLIVVEAFGPTGVKEGVCLDGGAKVFQYYDGGNLMKTEWGR